MPPDTDLDFDNLIESAAANLPQDSGPGPGSQEMGPAGTPPAAPAPSAGGGEGAPGAGTAPQGNPWDELPKAWKADYKSHWAKFDPAVRQYIHQREKEALDGITKYKGQLEPWQKVYEPFAPLLEQAGVAPQEATKRFLEAHIAFTYGSPEQKRDWLNYMVQQYGLADLLGGQPGNGQSQLPPEIQTVLEPLQRELQDLKRFQEQQQRERQDSMRQDAQRAVDTFMADSKNEFAKQLLPDMHKLLRGGHASDLASAYDMACKLNPEVSAVLLQRAIEAAGKPGKPAPKNVQGSPGTSAPTATKPKTIDETIEETAATIFSRS